MCLWIPTVHYCLVLSSIFTDLLVASFNPAILVPQLGRGTDGSVWKKRTEAPKRATRESERGTIKALLEFRCFFLFLFFLNTVSEPLSLNMPLAKYCFFAISYSLVTCYGMLALLPWPEFPRSGPVPYFHCCALLSLYIGWFGSSDS